MRGSVYYQVTQLIKCVFCEGAKKIDRVNREHVHFNCIASYETAASYRRIFENMFHYFREHLKLKNCELITDKHIIAYMTYKLEYYPSRQYFQKINSAIAKLEFALNKYSEEKYGFEDKIIYDFSIRKSIYNHANNLDLIASNYVNRAYDNPELIIKNLPTYEFRIAALIQLTGGARFEGVGYIHFTQLKGYYDDEIEKKLCGVIYTKEKGGKTGNVYIPRDLYDELDYYLSDCVAFFKIDYQKYTNEIKSTCEKLKIKSNSTHGFRWNFAQRRMIAYQKSGYSYEDSLLNVSNEMKHNRADITEHYL